MLFYKQSAIDFSFILFPLSFLNTVQPRYNGPLILRTFRYSVRFLRSRTERLFVFVFSTLILRTFRLTYI